MAEGSGGLAAAPASAANASSPRVGTRIEVYWPDDDVHYAGQVESYTTAGKAVVLYDDGDKEELDLADEVWRLEGARALPAGKSPVMPSRTTAASSNVPVAARETADQLQRVHTVVDGVARPSIASRAAPAATVGTVPASSDQRAAGGFDPAPPRAPIGLATALSASQAPSGSRPAMATQTNTRTMNVASPSAARMTTSVPTAARMDIDTPDSKGKAKGRKSNDGAKGSSSKSGRGRGRPKKSASKREMEDRSAGNPSKKTKSSRSSHSEDVEISGGENLTTSPRQDSNMRDVQSPTLHEGATRSPTKASASAVRSPTRNATPKGSGKNKQTITPSEVLHAASDVRALNVVPGDTDIVQVRSLVEQLEKQLAAEIGPLSKGISELAPLAKRVNEITPAVDRAVKASEDVKKELVPIQKEIATLASQGKESLSTYVQNVEKLNKELKENVGRLAKDIAEISKLSKENSSTLAQTVKENDRLSKMYTSLEGKFESLASAVDVIKTLVQNVSNKINENSKNDLSLERPDGRSRGIANGEATKPAKVRHAKQEVKIEVQDNEVSTTPTAFPVAISFASHFNSTVSRTELDGNANSSTQASDMVSRDIKPNRKPTPTVVVADSTVAAMAGVEYADVMLAAAVKKRGRLLLGQACLVWFQEGATRRDEPVAPDTMAHPRWAVETASLCLKTVAEKLGKAASEKTVFESCKETLPTDLEWFTEPSDVNLEKARRNYGRWNPPLCEWEWEIERKALTSVARRVGNAERACIVEKEDTALSFALRVIHTAIGPRKTRM